MSVTKQIVNLLSAKYNFSAEEGLEHVIKFTEQLKMVKSMTKEEKTAHREHEKEQIKAAKEQAKLDAKAAKEQAKIETKAAKEQSKLDAKAAKKMEKNGKKQNTNAVSNETPNSQSTEEAKQKKPRTEAQIAATLKMIETNKLKKIAAATLSNN